MVITEDRTEPADLGELLARARAGDSEAFCALAQEYDGRLYHQALGLCRDSHWASDLVSETMVECWKSLHRYDPTCRFSSWLFSILLHRYYKHLRYRRSRPVPLSSLPGAEDELRFAAEQTAPELTPADELLRTEFNAQVHQLVNSLPAKHRVIVHLRFFEGASLTEMASLLGCSLGTVKSRLHHALEKLRHLHKALNLFGGGRDTPA